MFKMHIVRNAVGSTMVTMLMAMGALGGAAFIVSEQMMGSEKVIKRDSSVEAYKQLVDLVRENLYTSGNCTAALGRTGSTGGSNVAAALSNSSATSPISGFNMNFGESTVALAPGWRTKTGTVIKSMNLKITNNISDTTRGNVRPHGEPEMKAALATLFIEPDHKGINIYKKDSSNNYIYDNLHIKLFVYVDPATSQITSCFDPASDAAFCTLSLGGAFNPNPLIPPSQRCQPDLKCFTGPSQVFSGSSGQACEAPYTAVKVGGINGGMNICSWCNPNALPADSVGAQLLASTQDLDLDLTDTDAVGNGASRDCSAAGYEGAGLTAQDQYEARQEYMGLIGSFSPTLTAPYADCLNYNPPRPRNDNIALLISEMRAHPELRSNALQNGYEIDNYNGTGTNYFWDQAQVQAAITAADEPQCAAGTSVNGSGEAASGSCRCNGAGELWNGGTSSCYTCSAGTSVSGQGALAAGSCRCNAAAELWNGGTSSCYTCPAGTGTGGQGAYVNGTACKCDTANFVWNAGSNSCQQVTCNQAAIDNCDMTACPIGADCAYPNYRGYEASCGCLGNMQKTLLCNSTTGKIQKVNDGSCGGDCGDGTRCFISGTQVTMKDGRSMSIEDVKVGDEVLTYDEKTKVMVVRPVAEVDHHAEANSILYTFTFSNGNEVTSNDIHRYYIQEYDNYLTASEIYQRHAFHQEITLLLDSGETVSISHVNIREEVVPLFNIHVRGIYDRPERESDKNHNFFANGVLVHNIKQNNQVCQ